MVHKLRQSVTAHEGKSATSQVECRSHRGDNDAVREPSRECLPQFLSRQLLRPHEVVERARIREMDVYF